ncbi:hypothetical protein [Streptomyces sp. A012304]|uniref:hypothetical protein n=1 Tax=Streptomyces sp. A012304 TaxID=375446 RepID=UPI0022323D78|nr:hypothetical protein [Streptomyces sp. A012304]GKQ35173.1 hypothetical protein ALMP_17190 [Streptomyces sp. A012304]
MSAREALYWALWDNYTTAEKNAFIDAHRDEVALEIGRDALRNGLAPTLTRLVGEANAAKLLTEQQPAVDAICREIVRLDEQRHAMQAETGDAAFWMRLQLTGEIIGLWKALCALNGWPMEEADKEGKADQYVDEWMTTHPESAGLVRPDEEQV